ncbi:hypothetical protein F5Y05DRAFT_334327 [Hypoxylon sp. FL0543]|nr:hypothetical protein F5Y05DRAFT_334327 [Hypoxylon sp. FL0543]
MNAGTETGPLNAQPYSLSTTLETHDDSRGPRIQVESNVPLNSHGHDPDASGHHRVQGASRNSCAACNASFSHNNALERHAQQEGHVAFVCSCSKQFTRPDALHRHIASFRKETPAFPCPSCKRHRGKHGFRRRDHLVQHLSGYHKVDPKKIWLLCPQWKPAYSDSVCPLPGCEHHRGREFHDLPSDDEKIKQKPFRNESSYKNHLKYAHNATPFPCPVAGCKRVDAKGYLTDIGLMEHLARDHSNAPRHLVKLQEELVHPLGKECDQCGITIRDLGEFNIHRRLLHQV